MRAGRRARSPRSKLNRMPTSRGTCQLFGEMLEDRLVLAQTTGLFFDNPGAADGYTLFSPNTSKTTFLIDNQGSVVHQWQSNYTPGLMGYMLSDGSLIRDGAPHGQGGNGSITAAGAGGLLERFDWSGHKIWEFSYDSPTHLAHHDFQVLPNGDVLLVAWELKTEAEATQAGRDPNLPGAGYLYPDSIVEVRPDLATGVGGDIVWQWHVWDHLVQNFDSTKSNWQGATGVADHPELINLNYVTTSSDGGGQAEDWNHTNGIDYNPALDQIVVSVREFSEVWIIDHSTTAAEAAGHSGGKSGHGGDLLYRWGNPQTYDRGTASDRVFYYQHDAKWIPDGSPGAGDITVFNNGFGRPGQDFTEVEEFTPPVDVNGNYPLTAGQAFGPAATTWHYQAPLEDFTAIIGGAQRLPNGNTRISYGVNGTFTEVTPAGQEVWKYVNPFAAAGMLGPNDPIPSLGLTQPGLDALRVNFTFQAVEYPKSYASQLTSTVVGRQLFYRNSPRYDTTLNPQTPLSFSDDNAVATDKVAYRPNSGPALATQPATLANISSYSRGINGVMVDIAGAHAAITASDFVFRTGNNNSPALWAAAPAPTSVFVRPGAGVSGSDRVEIIWPDGAIKKTWLEVLLKGNDALGGSDTHTGLAATDVFFFGNAVADSNSNTASAKVDIFDALAARNNPKLLGDNIPLTNLFDYNRDGVVDLSDETLARSNQTLGPGVTQFILIGLANVHPAQMGLSQSLVFDAGIASALVAAMPLVPSPFGQPSIPYVDPPSSGRAGFAARDGFFEQLAQTDTPTLPPSAARAGEPSAAAEFDDDVLTTLGADCP